MASRVVSASICYAVRHSQWGGHHPRATSPNEFFSARKDLIPAAQRQGQAKPPLAMNGESITTNAITDTYECTATRKREQHGWSATALRASGTVLPVAVQAAASGPAAPLCLDDDRPRFDVAKQ
ncbi:hypothetical protein MRX96_030285 [Rhipicephalus microplus]